MNYDRYGLRAPDARGWAAHRDRAGDAAAHGLRDVLGRADGLRPRHGASARRRWRTEGARPTTRAEEAGAAVPLALRRGAAAAWAGRTVPPAGRTGRGRRRAALAFAAAPALGDDRDRMGAVAGVAAATRRPRRGLKLVRSSSSLRDAEPPTRASGPSSTRRRGLVQRLSCVVTTTRLFVLVVSRTSSRKKHSYFINIIHPQPCRALPGSPRAASCSCGNLLPHSSLATHSAELSQNTERSQHR